MQNSHGKLVDAGKCQILARRSIIYRIPCLNFTVSQDREVWECKKHKNHGNSKSNAVRDFDKYVNVYEPISLKK